MFNLFKEYNNDFNGQCIYFLFLDGLLVYIGKTRELKRRIYMHKLKGNLVFNNVKYVPINKSTGMNITEATLIRFYQPVYNFRDNPRYYHLDKQRKEGKAYLFID